jgi:transposase-like protein
MGGCCVFGLPRPDYFSYAVFKVQSKVMLERFFREFRAKSDEIGAFPNETSCLTIFHLVMLRDHAKHQRFDFAKNSRH